MIIGAIFFAFVAASALVLLAMIVKSTVDEARANAAPAPQPRRVVLPGDREGRFVREGEPARRPVAH